MARIGIFGGTFNPIHIGHLTIAEEARLRAGLDRVLEYIQTKPFGPSKRVSLSCNRENIRALKLYKSKGFAETGAADEDEMELSLQLP